MSALPVLLRGAAAIGEQLGVTAKHAQHLHKQGAIPTFRIGGTPYATTAALDDWQTLYRAGKLPRE